MLRGSRYGSIAVLLLTLAACSPQLHPRDEAGQRAGDASVAGDSLTGWFHVIWGNGPEYALVTRSGESVRLVLEPVALDSIGDPLVLDRRRVTVLGQRVDAHPPTMHVFVIRFTPPDD
jgi:hypothetical protein